MDVVSGQIWDSFNADRGFTFANRHNLFDRSVNHIVSYADTNMEMPNKLPAPEMFLIKRVVFTFSKSCEDSVIYGFAERAVWSLWIGQKRYAHAVLISLPTTVQNVMAPIRICSFCQSVYCGDRACTQCGATQFTLGKWDLGQAEVGRQFILELLQELPILCQQTFRAEIECRPMYTLDGPLRMWCHLEGLHARGVQ